MRQSDLAVDGPAATCAGLGHEMLNFHLVYCQHHQSWCLFSYGGTSDTPGPVEVTHAGPFTGLVGITELFDRAFLDWGMRARLSSDIAT